MADPQMPLRGREEELASIVGALNAADAGAGAVVLLSGGGGSGKSRLLAEARQLAVARGYRCGYGDAVTDDHLDPMSTLYAALFGGPLPILPEEGLEVLRSQPPVRHWILLELQELLERAVADGPLLICLDDLQWADAGTIEALRLLPAALAGVPIVWLATYRPLEAAPSLTAAVDRLLDDVGAALHRLPPLDDAAVALLVTDALGSAVTDRVMDLAREAGGNPFLLREYLSGLVGQEDSAARASESELRVGGSRIRLGVGMGQRLDRLSSSARQAALVCAVLGRTPNFDHLAAMTGATPAALLEPVRELAQAEILDDSGPFLRFEHDLVREAVLGCIPPAMLKSLVRQAVEVLLAAGAAPLEVATRLSMSAVAGDELAIGTLSEAAGDLASTDPLAASQLSRQALGLLASEDKRRPGLVATTAFLLHASGRDLEARDFSARELGASMPAEGAAHVLLGVAQMYSLPADFRLQAGDDALAMEGVSPQLRARHLAAQVLNRVVASDLPGAETAAVEAEHAESRAHDATARLSLAFGRLAQAEAEFRYAEMPSAIKDIHRLGAEAGRDVEVQAAEWFRSSLLAHLDRFDAASAIIADGLATAQRDRQAWIAPRWDLWRGWVLLQQGDLPEAAATLEGAFSAEGMDLALALPDATGLGALGQLAVDMHDARLADKCVQIARATLAVGAFDEASRHITSMLAQIALARGDAAGARRELLAARRTPTEPVLPRLSRVVGMEPRIVRLAIAAGDQVLAKEIAAEATERARRNPDAASMAGVAAHAEGLLGDDPDLFAAAVRQLEQGARPMVLGSAAEDLGRVLLLSDHAAGVAQLNRAVELYDRAGARWHAQRVVNRLVVAGAAAGRQREQALTGWRALTRSEAAVAVLVAEGLTNRAAAERLGVSAHTVNTHLRHVFEKLAVHSRVELVRQVPAD